MNRPQELKTPHTKLDANTPFWDIDRGRKFGHKTVSDSTKTLVSSCLKAVDELERELWISRRMLAGVIYHLS